MIEGWRAEGYRDLMRLLRRRKTALGLTNLEIDARGNMPDGYFGKLSCGMRSLSLKSLDKVLAALQCQVVVVSRAEMDIVKLRPRKHKFEGPQARALRLIEMKKFAVENGRLGGRKRALLLTPARRRKIAQMAALARWRKENGGAPG